MHFKRHLLTASVATALLQLAACGGGSSSGANTEPTTPEDQTPVTETPVTQSLSGLTADGYLVNAKVCLDVNDNMACDEGEPSAMTTEGGQYEITEIPEELVVSEIAVVVEAIAGVTIDEDEPEVTIAEGYTLTAPAGKSKFISPLSTMLATQMEDNPELTEEEAQQVLEQDLGLEGTGVSLLDDYVAGRVTNETQAETYKQVHRVARAVAKTMAKALKQVDEEGEAVGDATRKEVRRAVVATLSENIETVISTIDDAVLESDELDITAVMTQLSEELPLSAEELEAKVAERRAKKQKTKVSYADLLAQGFYSLNGSVSLVAETDAEAPSCEQLQTPGYQYTSLIDSVLTKVHYSLEEGSFVEVIQEAGSAPLVWLDGAWQQPSTGLTVEATNEDGSLVVYSDKRGRQQVRAAEQTLDGKRLKSSTNQAVAWKGLFEPEAVFSEGSVGYHVTSKQLEELHRLPIDKCDQAPCNTIKLVSGEDATSVDQLLNAADAEFDALNRFYIIGNGQDALGVVLYGEAEAQSGEVVLYKDRNRDCAQEQCIQRHKEVGEWLRTERGIEFRLPGWVQKQLDKRPGVGIITEYDGLVRRAYTVLEGNLEHSNRHFNELALTDLTDNLDESKLAQELQLKACGIKPEKPAKGEKPEEEETTPEEGDTTEQEGDTSEEGEQEAPTVS